MARARLLGASRWRFLLQLLWRAAGGRALLFCALVLLVGLLPTAVILLTGALVSAIPAAAEHALRGPAAQPAVMALAGLVLALGALALGGIWLWRLCRVLD